MAIRSIHEPVQPTYIYFPGFFVSDVVLLIVGPLEMVSEIVSAERMHIFSQSATHSITR